MQRIPVNQHLMLAFKGYECPEAEDLNRLLYCEPAGFTLFRAFNIGDPEQVKRLVDTLQKKAGEVGFPPLLIGLDQEGGQLMAVGDCTQLPGNMALGATCNAQLAEKAGKVLGCELAAMGINLDYAPCADVNINPLNPVVGVRSFGEDPNLVAELSAAMVRGIQSQGVAATVKHFPGHGDTSTDSHLKMPTINHVLEDARKIDFPPFKLAIQEGVKLIMTGHLGLPGIVEEEGVPATLSRKVIGDLLRNELGFNGVVITDAMDMHAIQQGKSLERDAVKSLQAGVDLLLLTTDPDSHKLAFDGIQKAINSGALGSELLIPSSRRIASLRSWLAANRQQPGLEVIQCAEHREIARQIAEASVTLVRDQKHLLPLHLVPEARIAVILPQPKDLTPADTLSYIKPQLADALREFHGNVDEYSVSLEPNGREIAEIARVAENYDLVIAGTINAYAIPSQVDLILELNKACKDLVVVGLRLPYDLAKFPEINTYVCTYSILAPSMQALSRALFGLIPWKGQLPVTIPER